MDLAKLNKDFGKVCAYRDELHFLLSVGELMNSPRELNDKLLARAKFLKDETYKLYNENLNNELLSDLFKDFKDEA